MSSPATLLALCHELRSAAEAEAWDDLAVVLGAQDDLLRRQPQFLSGDRATLEAALSELNAALHATRERRDQIGKLLSAFGPPTDLS